VKRITVAVVIVVSASLAALVGAPARGGTSAEVLRIYDPTGQVKTELTISDIVRSSAVADRSVGGVPALIFALTKSGQAKFHVLTRALARRGARLHKHQVFAIAIDGHVYSTPFIDYKVFPGGFPAAGSPDMEMNLSSFALAKKLAFELRG
jgi:hypothetical protein